MYRQFKTYEAETDEIKFISYAIVANVILAFGFICNILALVIVYRSRLQGATPIYLYTMGISNFLCMLTSLPAIQHFWSVHCRPYEEAIYESYIELVLVNVSITMSIYAIVGLTTERYVSICHPTKFQKFHQKKTGFISLLLTGIIAIAANFIYALNSSVVKSDTGCQWQVVNNVAFTELSEWYVFEITSQTLSRFIPGTLMVILNVLILIRYSKVMQKRRDFRRSSSAVSIVTNGVRLTADDSRLISSCLILSLWFLVTTFPAGVLSILSTPDIENTLDFQIFRAVSNNMELFNYASNLLAVCLLSQKLSGSLKHLLTCSV